MEIEFQTTESDYKNFYKFYYKNELQKRKLAVILIPLLISYAFAGQPFGWVKFICSLIITEFLVLVIFYFKPYLVSINKLGKLISKEPRYLENKKLSITEDGIYFETVTRNGTWKWESIVSVISNEQFVSLRLADKRFYLIPKRAFDSDNEATNFIGIVQSEIIRVRGSLNFPTNSKDQKPPYLLGILCFIPMIGAFVGALFIIMGISKYKDKWITMIGAFGIIFTIVVYGVLFPQIWNKRDRDKQIVGFSQMWLNSLIKDIEFYKIEHGKYPENLKQLDSYEIYDPLEPDKEKKSLFNYVLVGDKYRLFSSGIDRIPNTKDDLYPEISANDSSKVGLIKFEIKQDSTKLRIKESPNR